jgi:hypothetical protein
MQDEPMMRVVLELRRHGLFKRHLDLQRRSSRRQSRPVSDAENMRVDGDGRLPEGGIHHHIRCLASHPWKLLQFLSRIGNLSAVPFDQGLGKGDHMPRLGSIEAD